MFISKISIERLSPGLYGWQVSCREEVMDRDAGDTSIADCLDHAVDVIPPNVALVEIVYCDAHMATMPVNAVRDKATEVARQIKSLHSALVETA